MIARGAFAQLGFSAPLLAATVVLMGLVYWAPPLLVLCAGDLTIKALGALAWLAMSVSCVPMLRFYRCPLLIAPLLPLIALFYVGATCASAVQFWLGRGGEWKGRFQAAPGLAQRGFTPRETPRRNPDGAD
jgi:hypothetical protein